MSRIVKLVLLSILFVWLVTCDSAFGPVEFEQTTFIKYYDLDPDTWSHEFARSGAITSDGGFIFIASEESSNNGGYNTWVVKTDPEGNIDWHQLIDLSYGDYGYDIIETKDGEFVICGGTSTNTDQAAVIKLSNSGQFIWQRMLGRDGFRYFTSVVETKTGVFTLTGRSADSIGVLLTSENMDRKWEKTYYPGTGKQIIQTSDGGFAIIGYSNLFGYDHSILIKIDAEGNEKWTRFFVADRWSVGLIETSGGGFVIATVVDAAIKLIKTDYNGFTIWESSIPYHRERGLSVNSIAGASDGGFVIVGSRADSAESTIRPLLVKTNASGEKLWERTLADSSRDGRCEYVQETPDQGFFIVGTCYNDSTYSDVFIAKTDELGLIKDESLMEFPAVPGD